MMLDCVMHRSTPLRCRDVDHVLVAALADDRQHAQLVAVVEHGRHVVGEIEIGAVGVARDHRDGVLVELVGDQRGERWAAAVAGARRLTCGRLRLAAASLPPAGRRRQPAAMRTAPRTASAASIRGQRTSPLPRNRGMCNIGIRRACGGSAPPAGPCLLRTRKGYHSSGRLQPRSAQAGGKFSPGLAGPETSSCASGLTRRACGRAQAARPGGGRCPQPTLPAWFAASERTRPDDRHHPDISGRQQAALQGRHHRRRAGRLHLQVARQEGGGDGGRREARRPGRPDRGRRLRQDRHPHRSRGAGADPARRRARDGGGRAGAVARHPGHHRPRDRERLLLRLRQGGALPPRRSRAHRGQDARDRRPQRALHQGALEPRRGQGLLQEEGRAVQDRAGRRHPRGRGPQDLQAGRVARSVPRPAHDLDRADRQGLQAHPLCGLLLARQRAGPEAAAHLRHRLGERAGACDLPQAARGSREARPPQARPRDGPLPFPGGGAGRRVLAPQGLGAVPEPHQLHPPPPERGRLSRGERAADPRQVDVGDLRALGDLPREHVHHRDRGRARVRHQADELSRATSRSSSTGCAPIASCPIASPSSASCTATSRRARCTG